MPRVRTLPVRFTPSEDPAHDPETPRPEGRDPSAVAPHADPALVAPSGDAPAAPAAPRAMKVATDAQFSGAIIELEAAPVGSRIVATVGGPVFLSTPDGARALPAHDPAARILPPAGRIVKVSADEYQADLPANSAIDSALPVFLKGYGSAVALLADVRDCVSRS